jgi:hypothetical protein
MFEYNDIQIYHNKTNNEYIPLAKLEIPAQYGPNTPIINGTSSNIPKDYLLQFYIGSVGVLGILVLYKFFEKS